MRYVPLAMVALFWGSVSAGAASFDCARAKAPVEIAICSDAELGALDAVMAESYNDWHGGPLSDQKTRTARVEDQRQWLAQRLSECKVPAKPDEAGIEAAVPCLVTLYRTRLAALAQNSSAGDEDEVECAEDDADHGDETAKQYGDGLLKIVVACTHALRSGGVPKEHLAEAFLARGEAQFGFGGVHNKLAIADFNEAIRLNDASSRAFSDRGFALFAAGQFADAAKDFDRVSLSDPTASYAVLWLYLAKSRAHDTSGDSFASTAAYLDLKTWPGPVVSFYLGKATADDVTAAVAKDSEDRQKMDSCEAAFYVGEFALAQALARGEKPDRNKPYEELLRKAVATCHASSPEFVVAAADAKR
ncbi:MAG TPA: lysozyme inhibitor LprI family protein [Stellaceae bacterium]|nr:lysozyme inhibitor LprI family protein [Stellaceae bacterium]